MNPVEEGIIPTNGEYLQTINSQDITKTKERVISMVERKNSLDRPSYRYYFNLEDEVVKLFVLVLTCDSNKKDENGDYLSREYLLSKIGRLNKRIPISLDVRGKEIFDMIIDDYVPRLFDMNYSQILEHFSSPHFRELRTKNQLARMSMEELAKFATNLQKEKELRDKSYASINELIEISMKLKFKEEENNQKNTTEEKEE